MMKPMPIKIQKIFSFIPVINSIGVFVLIYQCHTMKIGAKLLPKAILLIAPIILAFGIIMALVDMLFGQYSLFYEILSYASFYLIPLLIFRIIIYVQEKAKNTGDENTGD